MKATKLKLKPHKAKFWCAVDPNKGFDFGPYSLCNPRFTRSEAERNAGTDRVVVPVMITCEQIMPKTKRRK
jgi:hypothetical protein